MNFFFESFGEIDYRQYFLDFQNLKITQDISKNGLFTRFDRGRIAQHSYPNIFYSDITLSKDRAFISSRNNNRDILTQLYMENEDYMPITGTVDNEGFTVLQDDSYDVHQRWVHYLSQGKGK